DRPHPPVHRPPPPRPRLLHNPGGRIQPATRRARISSHRHLVLGGDDEVDRPGLLEVPEIGAVEKPAIDQQHPHGPRPQIRPPPAPCCARARAPRARVSPPSSSWIAPPPAPPPTRRSPS